MRPVVAAMLLVAAVSASAVIIDRIAIIVGENIIKNSDIDRDLRVTAFLNEKPLVFSAATRKEAANRLITQEFIRHEIHVGDYPAATPQQANQELDHLIAQRFKTQAAFEQALQHYGLTKPELQAYFQWQLTVLDFISARFKPAVYISGGDIRKYYNEHAAALKHEYPGKSEAELQDTIRDVLTGEQVNQQFFSWLDQQRKNAKIQYLEEGLQ